jgi:hypothetical protein
MTTFLGRSSKGEDTSRCDLWSWPGNWKKEQKILEYETMYVYVRYVLERRPMACFSKYFRGKNGSLTQSTVILCRQFVIALLFDKIPIFFSTNWPELSKIVVKALPAGKEYPCFYFLNNDLLNSFCCHCCCKEMRWATSVKFDHKQFPPPLQRMESPSCTITHNCPGQSPLMVLLCTNK